MVSTRRLAVASALAFATALLTGCSSFDGASPTPSVGDLDIAAWFRNQTGVELEDAPEALGMSADIVALYDEIGQRGYVLSSDVRAALPEFADCVSVIGVDVEHDPDAIGPFGVADVSWSIVVPSGRELTDADDAVVFACMDRTVGPIENLFFNQPVSPERAEVWESDGRRELAANCIENAGYFARPDGSMEDYIALAKSVSVDTGSSECLDLVLFGAPDE